MYQREAMWLNFDSDAPMAIKIYVGGINAVSGEPAIESRDTVARRLKLLAQSKSLQDYVVTPDQLWLDGVADSDGTVRQFVAMPVGSGYSLEAQITGADAVCGLQIEVTPSTMEARPREFTLPLPPKPPGCEYDTIVVRTSKGDTIAMKISPWTTTDRVKRALSDRLGISMSEHRLMFGGNCLYDGHTLSDYDITHGAPLEIWREQCGGGKPSKEMLMGVAAGGLIKQTINRDKHDPAVWQPSCGTIFNVQLVDSSSFKQITGEDPPPTLVSVKTYAEHGFPYHSIWDEKKSGIHGAFSDVKSVKQMDFRQSLKKTQEGAVEQEDDSVADPIVLLDSNGKSVGFRSVSQLEREVREASRAGGV